MDEIFISAAESGFFKIHLNIQCAPAFVSLMKQIKVKKNITFLNCNYFLQLLEDFVICTEGSCMALKMYKSLPVLYIFFKAENVSVRSVE